MQKIQKELNHAFFISRILNRQTKTGLLLSHLGRREVGNIWMCQTNNFNKILMTFPNPTATNQGTKILLQMVMMLIYLPVEVKQKLRQVNEGRAREESDSAI